MRTAYTLESGIWPALAQGGDECGADGVARWLSRYYSDAHGFERISERFPVRLRE